jgi:NAD(P)H-nitrite reductase large subunit
MANRKCDNCGDLIDMKSFPETCPSCGRHHGFSALKAILQRDNETYAVAPHIPGGIITDFNLLRKLADVAERYEAQAIKITSAGRFALVGFKETDINSVWEDLGLPPSAGSGLCVRSVKLCPGTSFCKRGLQDAVGVGLRIDEKYYGYSLPYKLKIGVSGCTNTCAESTVKDIGLIGMKGGWRVVVGGLVTGLNPRFADVIADNLDDEQALRVVDDLIEWYCAADIPKRIGRIIDDMGLNAFKAELGLAR